MNAIELLNEQIEYIEEKDKSKNILFFHGFHSSLSSFVSLKKLKRNYNIIAFNFPGHGNSTFNEEISLKRYIEIAKEFVIKKQLKDLIVVGHSLGGAVAVGVSNMKEIKKIVLLAPFNPYVKNYHNLKMLKNIFPNSLEEARQSLKLMVQNKNKKIYFKNIDFTARVFYKKVQDTQKRFHNILFNELNSQEFHKNFLYKIYKNSSKEKIEIFNSDKDYFVPKESSEKTAKIFSYQFYLIKNIGHSIIYEHTQEMNHYFNKLF